MLALVSPLLALHIENLERLKADLDEIINIHSDGPLPDEAGGIIQQNQAADPRQAQSHRSWPKDCSELPASSSSGIYIIQPTGMQTIVVYCEMSRENGGWTVIQRNHRDTPVSWDESWSTYKHGFGNVHTEFWLGTEYIHQITRQKVYQVRFAIWDASNNMKFADYNLFSLGDESQGYQLRLGAHSGTAEDAMASKGTTTMHDNMKFSAKDRDQDTSSGNCATSSGGGWWYSACYSVRLNFKGGMTWGSLCQGNCRASAILIKPTTYC
ncbi:fibrinogen-like protein 1-like protein isoform X2 [Corvus hawaiiensis]|nr:PREDICTED: fibrinogen-like protein 1-like protein isoform X2 [Corvus brachyrhynchos]XP_017593613.1 PREDICTED: fibrinogen-like protein 1-like protein isoform X2 [Corvus brachyrhynchos]XP_031985732.1 fibrinogen-like protein 1-like protein isoform X2 [Corvus moneduloides]XP_041881749.1 fibrinogen-like protein 1-like protein isoform X2 [Corvus kubaryi]XP_041881750.1 fibrinogen-like protein 1-like protein isoform X2 [Corvus kubaryi]XP_048180467.1 fibrinogen-like protein 1-like protein isoform X2